MLGASIHIGSEQGRIGNRVDQQREQSRSAKRTE